MTAQSASHPVERKILFATTSIRPSPAIGSQQRYPSRTAGKIVAALEPFTEQYDWIYVVVKRARR